MNKDLIKGTIFAIHERKKHGTMRSDWADGRLCNQWNPTNLLAELKTDSGIDLVKLQQELNYLQFEVLSSFEGVGKYCGGTGYDKELLLTISLEVAEYAIKLTTVKDAYSYIYTYIK
ncbi:hypothetical protein [Clostridium estertheticum]|uniref:hypothetical protein n=1 Tax=Clostridium estertheticum TaxID=238834 RepID=UPI001CF597E1|nr:hypothetical protein [Clostridium estertheticum]MCB2354726.1 hypothetical protein [Clostridium estertheticum]WAG40968.1 hypothetical protein LL065_22440 [Clostridium estertheticum]